jgi:hypothetical protein
MIILPPYHALFKKATNRQLGGKTPRWQSYILFISISVRSILTNGYYKSTRLTRIEPWIEHNPTDIT